MTGTAGKKKDRAPETDAPVLAVKGFDPSLSCRGHQFEIGKTYKVSGKIKACENGFHACENPFDVWSYYPVVNDDGKLSRYALVELTGRIDRHADDSKIADSKIASAEITLKCELSLPEFIGKAIDWIIDLTKKVDAPSDGKETLNDNGGNSAQIGSSGDYAKIGSSGDYARIGSSGYSAQIGSSGDSAQIGSSGNSAQIGSSGNYARIGSSGDYAKIGSSGHSAKIGSSGHSAKIGSSGDSAKIGSSGHSAKIGSSGDSARIGSSGNSAQIGSSGDYAKIGSSGHSAKIGSSGHSAKIVSEGENAVIASAGKNAAVSAKSGTWISLAEFDGDGKCVGFATGCIGQDGLKPGTLYIARGGKLVEAE